MSVDNISFHFSFRANKCSDLCVIKTSTNMWNVTKCISSTLTVILKQCALFTGVYSLCTVSEVSVKAGALVSIPCNYNHQYRNHVKYLCEGYSWISCLYRVKTNSQSDSNKYSISDDKSQSIFTVTIKQLTFQNTDYWCAVEVDGYADLGCYFHLSVTTGKQL